MTGKYAVSHKAIRPVARNALVTEVAVSDSKARLLWRVSHEMHCVFFRSNVRDRLRKLIDALREAPPTDDVVYHVSIWDGERAVGIPCSEKGLSLARDAVGKLLLG